MATLFQRGHFDALAVVKTSLALQGYGAGLLGLIGVKILAPGFYARQDMRTPVTIAIIVLVLTQAMNVAFVPWLGHAGLALSVSLGAVINAVWLFIGLRRGGWYRPAPGWRRFTAVVVVATALMAAVLVAAETRIDWIGMAGRQTLRVAELAGCILAAALVYFGVLLVGGFRAARFFPARLRRRRHGRAQRRGDRAREVLNSADVRAFAAPPADRARLLHVACRRRRLLPLLETAIAIAQHEYPTLDTPGDARGNRRVGGPAEDPDSARCDADASPAAAQPLLLPGARLRRQRQRLLRPAQQLCARRSRVAARHPDPRWP